MALNSLRDMTSQSVLGSLLMICMLIFAIGFMYSNNPNGLGTDTDSIFNNASGEGQSLLLQTTDDSDAVLNITSNTNPEASDLGSRDSVATSYSASGSIKDYFDTSKQLIGWVFSGTTGKMLLGVISGLVGWLLYFFIVKHIRTGD